MFDILKVGKNYPQKESGSHILVMILLVFPPRHRIPRTRQLSKDTETVNQPGRFPHSIQSLQTALRRAQILDYLTPHNDVDWFYFYARAETRLKNQLRIRSSLRVASTCT